ncbi:MAG: TetR/AcrR family transcriptional regulator [Sphaerochaetaceae bacterium]|nr:TetR/AcrR family transcriptional regulator [Sphaerochaetaceae bacterium]
MPKKINHDLRKEKILKTALDVFAREGYKDSNLSLIAHECGISRPTIYQYFKDKEEIYYFAVKLVTGRMFKKYADYAWSNDENAMDRIFWICNDVLEYGIAHLAELSSLVDVMILMKREGTDFNKVILKRTAKLNILFKRLLRQGKDAGDIVSDINIEEITEHITFLLESFCLEAVFLGAENLDKSKDIIYRYLFIYKK